MAGLGKRIAAKAEPATATKTRGRAKVEPEVKPRKTRAAAVVEKTKAPVRRSTRGKSVMEEVDEVLEKKPRNTRTSKTAVAVKEEKVATTRTKKVTRAEVAEEFFDPYRNINDTIDAIEKKNGLSDSGLNKNEKRLSTGILVLDLVLGGGIVGGGWYTIYGHEQVGKSTMLTTLMTAGLNSGVPIQQMHDYEGSTEPNYVESIIQTQGIRQDVESVFGIKDRDGNWVVKPRVRLYKENISEKFFDSTSSLLRKLPEKVMIGEEWFYLYENNKENQKFVGQNYDKAYFKRTNKFKIPAPDGTPQGLLYVDSYPAMLPEKQDVEDPNSTIAMQARMFSEQIPRIKGRLRGRKVTIIGVNSIRVNPMQMFGNKEYEPGGNALKLNSDVRLHLASLSLASVPGITGKGSIEEEPSVEGKGKDTYRYIRVRAVKNKLSTPYLEGWLRIWSTDRKGQGRGYCPVWDTYQYLLMTGQATGGRAKMKVALESGVTFTCDWLALKRLLTTDTKTVKAQCEALKIKPFKLRDYCFKQIRSGKGFDMFFAKKAGGDNDEEADESDDREDGDDGADEA